MAERKSISERFWSKVDKRGSDECWLWLASFGTTGYGQFHFDSGMTKAPRAAWTLVHGPIPKGLCVLHSCDVRACVNPAHLRIGTKRENTQDMVERGRGWTPSYKGSKHPNAKLSDNTIICIRSANGTLKEIGARFGIHLATAARIRSRKSWAHIS